MAHWHLLRDPDSVKAERGHSTQHVTTRGRCGIQQSHKSQQLVRDSAPPASAPPQHVCSHPHSMTRTASSNFTGRWSERSGRLDGSAKAVLYPVPCCPGRLDGSAKAVLYPVPCCPGRRRERQGGRIRIRRRCRYGPLACRMQPHDTTMPHCQRHPTAPDAVPTAPHCPRCSAHPL